MKSLWFVMPIHGRLPLAAICLRQLRRTCDALTANGVHATAVVISDPQTIRTLDPTQLGFATVERDNQFLGRRFNDGIQLATDPLYNPAPADFVVPFGSDDWADHRLFLEPLPAPHELFGFQRMSFVSEDGSEIASTFLNYEGGAGIRIIPRELVASLGYRPADEDRPRGCDTSILRNLRAHHGDRLTVRHWHMHDRQIVDWKTPVTQLNSFESITKLRSSERAGDPFAELAGVYPADALEEMRDFYASMRVAEEVAA